MAEISARDLRRLQALEGRLTKATEERRALAAARRELRSALTETDRRKRSLERELGSIGEQLEAVLAENKALAARLDEATADLERLKAASLDLRTQLDAEQAELKGVREALDAAEGQLTEALSARDEVAGQLKIANEQLAEKGITPVLPAEQVAKLLDSLVGAFDRGLPDLVVRDGEIRLQVAFAQVGDELGFVVPSPGAPAEIRESLHQVALRLDRTFELPGTENP